MRLRTCLALTLLAASCSSSTPPKIIPPGQILGRVELSTDVPASTCEVLIEGTPLGGTCDQDGYFFIRNVPAGQWDLRITLGADATLPARRAVAGINAGLVSDLGTLKIAKPGAVGGRILGGTVDFIGAVVAVPGIGAVTAPSDQGAYLLDEVVPGVHDVLLISEKGQVIHASVGVRPGKATIGVDFDLTVAAPRVVKVRGKARRAGQDDGTHAGLSVELVESRDGKVIASATTGADGAFELSGPEGTYLVRAAEPKGKIISVVPSVILGAAEQFVMANSLMVMADGGDLDGDGLPDASDPDIDNDGHLNAADAFPFDPAEWKDSDGDGIGDRADLRSRGGKGIDVRHATPDTDKDGKFDFEDNCVKVTNADQLDGDQDGVGDACDNCPKTFNVDQADLLGNGTGDLCRVCAPLGCKALGKNCGLIPDGCGGVADCGACSVAGQTCGGSGNPNVCGAIPCLPTTCAKQGKGCGKIDDGCGAQLDCGSCTVSGQSCGGGGVPNVCGKDCAPTSCVAQGKNCGLIPSGCVGPALDCGACSLPGESCGGAGVANVCGKGCKPTTCAAEGKGCGFISDGCGGAIDCGACTVSGDSCGGGGVPNVCGKSCKPTTCALSGKNCGLLASGCAGQILDCGSCTVAGDTCGGGGVNNVCGSGCAPTSCSQAGKNCGLIPNGCGGAVDCGSCTVAGESCGGGGAANVCGSTCKPTTCAIAGKNCGLIANGCGGVLDCGGCTTGQSCGGAGTPNVCGSTCPATTCAAQGKNCGFISNGCGGVIDCGSCTASGQTCGGGGTSSVCGAPCKPTTCAIAGKNCGLIPNGCGGALDCGGCSLGGETCSGGGVANVCGKGCLATTCAAQGKNCGTIGDNCGGQLSCGSCGAGQVCGAGGTANVCAPGCTVQSCGSLSKNCGYVFDGCGAQLFCGTCSVAGESCGGGGTANVCGKGCIKVTCAGQGKDCGAISDGCGGTLDCGSCTYPQACGAQGTANKCQTCPTLTTCAAQGKNCGTIPDGCTGTLNCGGCSAPETCGGTGNANVCGLGPNNLTVTAGDGQTAAADQALGAVVILVTNRTTGQPVPNLPVSYVLPPGAAANPPSGITDAQGQATVQFTLGRAPGAYSFQAIGQGGSAVTITATATAPVPGNIFTVINTLRTSSPPNTFPLAGTLGRLSSQVLGVQAAKDGTLYVSDTGFNQVLTLSPSGVLTRIAGSPSNSSGNTGDYGPATAALLNRPMGLALDEAGGRLYIADSSNNRVRYIDLSVPGGNILPFAGSGAGGTYPFGDGGAAVSAQLFTPSYLTLGVGSDKALYISDTGHTLIRRVDFATNAISTFFPSNIAGNCGTSAFAISQCGNASTPGNLTCAVAFDAAGNTFISGGFCGTSVPNPPAMLVVRRSPTGQVSVVAGGGAGLPATDGVVATSVTVPQTAPWGYLTFDPAGNLFVAESSRLRRIEGSSGRLSTVAGSAVNGFSGNFVPASSAGLSIATAFAFDQANTLYLADANAATVRAMAGAGTSTASAVSLTIDSGDNQPLLRVGEKLPVPLVAKVTDSANQPVGGMLVRFSGAPGVAVYSPTALTNSQGLAATGARPGLSPKSYTVQASLRDLHDVAIAPVTFTLDAAAAASGVQYPIINADHTALSGVTEGAASMSHVGEVTGVAVVQTGWNTSASGGTDIPAGTIFISDYRNHAVLKVTPDGVLILVAGGNGGGNTGDFGPGNKAQLWGPRGLAISESGKLLYVAESASGANTDRVRAIDLSTPAFLVSTFAGGNGPVSGNGDGSTANLAYLTRPSHLALSPLDGSLWISEISSPERIRRVDGSTKVITTIFNSANGGCPGSGTPVFYACNLAGFNFDGCGMTFDKAGNLFISAAWCTGNYGAPQIVKRDPSGVLTLIAGKYCSNCAFTEGLSPLSMILRTVGSTGIEYDKITGAMTGMFVTDPGSNKIRHFDPSSTAPMTITVGDGTSGFQGDFISTPGIMTIPADLAMTPAGNLVFADYSNGCVRARQR